MCRIAGPVTRDRAHTSVSSKHVIRVNQLIVLQQPRHPPSADNKGVRGWGGLQWTARQRAGAGCGRRVRRAALGNIQLKSTSNLLLYGEGGNLYRVRTRSRPKIIKTGPVGNALRPGHSGTDYLGCPG